MREFGLKVTLEIILPGLQQIQGDHRSWMFTFMWLTCHWMQSLTHLQLWHDVFKTQSWGEMFHCCLYSQHHLMGLSAQEGLFGQLWGNLKHNTCFKRLQIVFKWCVGVAFMATVFLTWCISWKRSMERFHVLRSAEGGLICTSGTKIQRQTCQQLHKEKAGSRRWPFLCTFAGKVWCRLHPRAMCQADFCS